MRHAATALLPLLFATLPAQQPLDAGEFAAACRLLEPLGVPRLADAPFVRVATGRWSKTGNEPPQNSFIPGFLLADDGRQFTVLTLDLDREVFVRTPPGTAEHQRVGYAVQSLPDLARATIAELQQPDYRRPFDVSFGGKPRPGQATSLFALAYGCEQQHEPKLARELAALSKQAFREPQGQTLAELLQRDLGHAAFWRLVLAFGDPQVAWAQHLADCERFLQQFPRSQHAERATAMRTVLQRMLRDQPPPAAAGPLAALVFELREQNGRQWCQPGWCDVFADPRGEQSPAQRLVAHGWPALPFLLPALDDDGFTRCVGYHRDFYFSHQVLAVREVAAAVASRITGSQVASRADAERLWQQYRRDGELAVLIEGAASGNVEQAERLLQLDAAAALAPLQQALGSCAEAWRRVQLVALLSGIEGDAALGSLRATLAGDGDVRVRAAAAAALHLRGEREPALQAMLAAWRQDLGDDDAGAVGCFLAVCGDRRGIDALAARPQRLDDDLIAALGSGSAPLPPVRAPGRAPADGPTRLAAADAEVDAAVEALLAALLDVQRICSGSWGGTSHPRIADFAAQALQQRWPQRYAFDFEAPRPRRERQLLAMRNQWRQQRGEPPLPARPLPPIAAVDTEAVQQLLLEARHERSDAPRRRLLDRIEALGLGALPAVRQAAAAAREPGRQDELQALQLRIASCVRTVRLGEGSAPFPAAVREPAMALVGRPLDVEALVDVLCAIGAGDAAAPARARLSLARDDDGSGVVVEFTFAGGPRGGGSSVHYTVSVGSGLRNLHNCTGAGVRSVAADRVRYREFAAAVAAALLAPEDQLADAVFELAFD